MMYGNSNIEEIYISNLWREQCLHLATNKVTTISWLLLGFMH